ncbi:MAG: type II toxin-antitoxin system Phd/YefM family antitoxin [Burkholderiales bacterium]
MNIGIYEAKSRLSDLLDKVRSGKEIIITRHGEPVAKLVPMNPRAALDRARTVREVRALSKRLNIRAGTSLRKLIDEGRD